MVMSSSLPVSYEDVVSASHRLQGVAHRTPVLTSRTVDSKVGASVHFKCENFQRGGAFKFRGAYNALSRLAPERGALAFSSGNHAQAVALAGRLLGISVTIVMPENAPEVKRIATREYGAEVVLYDPQTEVREELAGELAEERGLTLIPPFDNPFVIAGQGTAARELLEETGPLDVLLVCCGGGGLLSGCATVARALSPGCAVIGVEPVGADDATRSFHTGELQRIDHPDTIADGARTPSLGKLTFPIIRALVSDMVTVGEREILDAMRFLAERLKIVVEPTGALAPAALLSGAVERPGQKIGVVISGGNVDLAAFAQVADSGT